MRLLGAILAGGQSRRFGTDKALATLDGARLIDLVAATLSLQCDGVVVCGRADDAFECLPDLPHAGLGPLGGLNAALHHARAHGFDAVLSSGCDVPNLPRDLSTQLGGAAASHAADQPVVGWWCATLAGDCSAFLQSGGRSLYRFAAHVGARAVTVRPPLRNINRPVDLAPVGNQ
ncbi:molybdenum cofactor guanylyltransferase [Parerythrobacter aurantius]|uniref:molybdenum cofactor guanylyltransferase n=1 Tax=Parerythrobacter aurantius TaxID=3127706 RepID=UPI003250BB5E